MLSVLLTNGDCYFLERKTTNSVVNSYQIVTYVNRDMIVEIDQIS